jgi:hypothetical protein
LLSTLTLDYWLKQDETLIEDLEIERNVLNCIRQDVIFNNDVKYWFSGHMHTDLSNNIDNVEYKIIGKNSLYSHTIY